MKLTACICVDNGLQSSGAIILLDRAAIDGYPTELNGAGISSDSGGGLCFDPENIPDHIFNQPRKRIAL